MAMYSYYDPSLTVTVKSSSEKNTLSNGFVHLWNLHSDEALQYRSAVDMFIGKIEFAFHEAYDSNGNRLFSYHGLYVSDIDALGNFADVLADFQEGSRVRSVSDSLATNGFEKNMMSKLDPVLKVK